MIAILLIALVLATSVLVATSLRLGSLASAFLAGYVALVAEVTGLTAALSPFRAVTREGLLLAEVAVLAIVFAIWWLRGRPRLPLGATAVAVRQAARSPAVVVLFGVVVAALAYQLALVAVAPPNNWDSLTYHLARAAAWMQHGGVYWIPNAPTYRMNEFQPVAEQEILYLFVATGRGALFALPQLVAEIALLVAVYASARRLGHDVRSSVCTALVFSTFTLVALESTTAQNDLVAASLPAAAAALLLAGGRVEIALAGVAVALGLGVKITSGFALPVLVALAAMLGRRAVITFATSAAAAFALLGMWGFVLNLAHTGHPLGTPGNNRAWTASPSFPGTLATAYRLVCRLFDASGFTASQGVWLARSGVVVALAVAIVLWRRGVRGWSVVSAAGAAALPLLTPVLVVDALGLAHRLASAIDLPVNDPASTISGRAVFTWAVNRTAHEDVSGFGPLGGPALLGASAFTLTAAVRRRGDSRKAALACALPLFTVLIALTLKYNPWLMRFLLTPAALTAPLLATLFTRRAVCWALVVISVLTLSLAHWDNAQKPLSVAGWRPWELTRTSALPAPVGAATAQLDELLGSRACVAAEIGDNDPSYLLFGPTLHRHVTFLGHDGALGQAARSRLRYLVLLGASARTTGKLRQEGRRVRLLDGYWQVAEDRAAPSRCRS